jgi:hypothetical protein
MMSLSVSGPSIIMLPAVHSGSLLVSTHGNLLGKSGTLNWANGVRIMRLQAFLREIKDREFAWKAIAVALVGTVIGAISSYIGGDSHTLDEFNSTVSKVERNHTEIRFLAIETEVNELRQAVAKAGQKPLQDAALQNKLLQVDRVQHELDELKSVIVENPTRALSLPLMRKDIADLSKRQDAIAISVEVEINRIYDFSKWFLALMITLAIGLVTMGFYRPKDATRQ